MCTTTRKSGIKHQKWEVSISIQNHSASLLGQAFVGDVSKSSLTAWQLARLRREVRGANNSHSWGPDKGQKINLNRYLIILYICIYLFMMVQHSSHILIIKWHKDRMSYGRIHRSKGVAASSGASGGTTHAPKKPAIPSNYLLMYRPSPAKMTPVSWGSCQQLTAALLRLTASYYLFN